MDTLTSKQYQPSIQHCSFRHELSYHLVLIPFTRGSLAVIIQKGVLLPCLTSPEFALLILLILLIYCTLTATCAQSCGTFLEGTCFFWQSEICS